MDHTLAAAAAAGPVLDPYAQVRAADHVTRYVRLGVGRPVVVLDECANAGSFWPELVARLAEQRRVIVPEVPTAGRRFNAWLRGFVEGMGLPPVALVVAGELCMPSIEFALLEPERLESLVLVPSGTAEATGLAGALTSSLGSADVAMLVIRRDEPLPDALRVIEEFLTPKAP